MLDHVANQSLAFRDANTKRHLRGDVLRSLILKDKGAYLASLKSTIENLPKERTHGFRFRGQYEQQVPQALKIADKS